MKIRKQTIIQLVIDLVLLLLVGIPYLVVHLKVKPFWRGFFCDDESIQYPYRDDTVTMGMCTGVGITIAVVSFVVVELLSHHSKLRSGQWLQVMWLIGKDMLVYFVGLGVSMVIAEVGKLVIGRPRPHFLSVCQPDFVKINCSMGYIEDFVCSNMGMSGKLVLESRKSFPSGHSTFSAYTAFFLGYYYYQRMRNIQFSYLLTVILQLAVAVLGCYVMFSRISDYKHHWSDVLVGGLIGLFGAVWAVFSMGQHVGFNTRRRPPSSPWGNPETPITEGEIPVFQTAPPTSGDYKLTRQGNAPMSGDGNI